MQCGVRGNGVNVRPKPGEHGMNGKRVEPEEANGGCRRPRDCLMHGGSRHRVNAYTGDGGNGAQHHGLVGTVRHGSVDTIQVRVRPNFSPRPQELPPQTARHLTQRRGRHPRVQFLVQEDDAWNAKP
jgi:hypothetical protein